MLLFHLATKLKQVPDPFWVLTLGLGNTVLNKSNHTVSHTEPDNNRLIRHWRLLQTQSLVVALQKVTLQMKEDKVASVGFSNVSFEAAVLLFA